jgi:hypothetical protein
MSERRTDEELEIQHTRDIEEREEQRRADDTRSDARHPDTGAGDEPPEPFSGPMH